MPTLTIDGRNCTAPAGATVLDAAAASGIEIPTLCHHPDLAPVGSCRLCLVELAGQPGEHAACTLLVAEGMVVATETPALAATRKAILELLLHDYVPPDDAQTPPGTASPERDTEFDRWVRRYGAEPPSERVARRHPVDSDPNPFIRVDMNQCILCTRCVRACDDVQGRFVWGVAERGAEARIVAGADTMMLEARCESCGACAAYCPTGALVDRMPREEPAPDRLVRTTCGYCGVGCQFDLNVSGDRVVAVTSTPEAPVNGMSLCVKGRYGYDFLHHAERLTRPRVRQYLLDGKAPAERPADRGAWVEVDWETALDLAAERLATIGAESGPDAIGLLSSAKCTNEENYLMQKLARQVIGTHNVDHCARLCHSSTVAGLAMAYGSGAMSNSMDDIAAHAEALLVIGSNTTEQHPVFGAMLRQAVLHRGARLVVADPRRIDLAEHALLHLRQRPGTDVALINGLMQIAMARGWHDESFIEARCEGFAEFRDTLARYTPDIVSETTGVPREDLERAAEILCRHRPMAVIWAMGITQHTTGVLNVLALANLQMLLGNIGLPGGGVNPLRGQNNVQGACDMGGLPNVFPGYQAVTDDDACEKFRAGWEMVDAAGARSPQWSDRPGLTVTELVDAAGRGDVRALYVLGEDPAMTEPDTGHVEQALARAELIVLQEIFPSETARFADVLLPGAAFAEKEGTFTNTERRVQLIRTAVPPPGEARPDWQITADLARRMLRRTGRTPRGPQAEWEYASAAEIQDEIAALTPSYAGVSHARLEASVRLQWPVPAADHPGTPILHVDQFTRGKGKFHAVEHLPPAELPDDDYPLVLTTGRVLYHWHGGELTRRAAGLTAVCPEPMVEVAPDDAARLGIAEGGPVTVRSRRGRMEARAIVTERVSPGLVFGNFHFPAAGNVNNLTIAALDPVAKIPEYKVCAVALAVGH